MKKVSYDQYGGVEVLKLIDVPIPQPAPSQLLVKVKAVSINPLDWKIRKGTMKLMAGSKFPKNVGIDFSGVVEAVGNSVKGYKAGDAVFGLVEPFKGGALAEYLLLNERDLSLKPQNISFAQAAALPTVGLAALQIMDQLVTIKPGTQVLINGAAGGIGMMALQLAKQRGAIVTSVVGSNGLSWAKKWGSDSVVNYKTENILQRGKQYDVVIDLSGKLSFQTAKVLLKPKGVYVNSVPGPKQIIGSFFNNLFSGKKYKVLLLKPTTTGLNTLARLASDDGIQIHIGASYPMESYMEAYSNIPKGGTIGKAVFVI